MPESAYFKPLSGICCRVLKMIKLSPNKERLPDRVCRKASDQIKETWIDQDARLFFYLAVTIGLDHCLEASPAAFHQIGNVQAGSNAPISADRRDISLT